MEIVELVAENETVVGHFKCSGTHTGEWLGIPPTGRRFEGVDEIYIFHVKHGKLASDRRRGQPLADAPARNPTSELTTVGVRPSFALCRRASHRHSLGPRLVPVIAAATGSDPPLPTLDDVRKRVEPSAQL